MVLSNSITKHINVTNWKNTVQLFYEEYKKGVLIMKNYKVYVKGMYTGEIELLASEVVAVERDFEIKLVEVSE